MTCAQYPRATAGEEHPGHRATVTTDSPASSLPQGSSTSRGGEAARWRFSSRATESGRSTPRAPAPFWQGGVLLAADRPDLSADVEHTPLVIDVRRAQAEHLTLPQPAPQTEHHGNAVAGGPSGPPPSPSRKTASPARGNAVQALGECHRRGDLGACPGRLPSIWPKGRAGKAFPPHPAPTLLRKRISAHEPPPQPKQQDPRSATERASPAAFARFRAVAESGAPASTTVSPSWRQR